jgi:hypothetical protein
MRLSHRKREYAVAIEEEHAAALREHSHVRVDGRILECVVSFRPVCTEHTPCRARVVYDRIHGTLKMDRLELARPAGLEPATF